jgi:hypothetical protein
MQGRIHRGFGRIGRVASLALLLALAACGGGDDPDPVFGTRLTGEWIARTVAGNTLSGVAPGGYSWVEYYDPSGQIRGLRKGGDGYAGSWSIDGDTLCLSYTGGQGDGCYALSAATGNKIFLFDKDDKPLDADRPATMVWGNPNGL